MNEDISKKGEKLEEEQRLRSEDSPTNEGEVREHNDSVDSGSVDESGSGAEEPEPVEGEGSYADESDSSGEKAEEAPSEAEAEEVAESDEGENIPVDETNDASSGGDDADASPDDASGLEGSPETPRDAEAAQPKGETGPAVEEKKSKMKWYVVHTYSGRENKVKETIERVIKNSGMEDRFGKVLVATEEVAEMKKGKKKVSHRKLFPSYIIIEMEMSDETWGLIENVPGVTHFVGGVKKPFPIPKKDVDRILGRMEKKEGIIPEVPFTLGEHVRVVDGPFADFTGVVDEINPERGKVKVLVSIFGRETPVELDFLQVKSL